MFYASLLKRDKHVRTKERTNERRNERASEQIKYKYNGNVMGFPITPYIQ